MNSDNLSEKTRAARRASRARKVMRVHGSGMKKLATRLGQRKKAV